jgi:hypothetical protein
MADSLPQMNNVTGVHSASTSGVSMKAPLELMSRTRPAPLMPIPAQMRTLARHDIRLPHRCSMAVSVAARSMRTV